MAMPETAVNEDHFSVPGENNVGFPGKISCMETKPVSHRVRKPADEQFGFGVDSANARHNRASLLGAKNICHDIILAPCKQDSTAVERSLRLLGQNPGADYSRGLQGQNRTARLEARIAPEALAVVRRAAEVQGRSVTDFVVAAAQEAANRAIEETEIIRLSLHGQRRLAGLLLNPHQPPNILRVFVERFSVRRKSGIPSCFLRPTRKNGVRPPVRARPTPHDSR
jgi:uncharacterized protein (DUF1778 family)